MISHVAAPVPAALAEEARAVAERLRTEQDSPEIREEAVRVILQLTDEGLKAFFLRPVERIGLGFIGRSAVEVGLKTATGAISVFIKRLGRSMTEEQGRTLGHIMDEILVDLVFEEEDGDDEDFGDLAEAEA